MSLLFAALIAGEELRLAQPLSEQEYVDFLNADANPSISYDCRFHDREGSSYRVHFAQSGGYVYFEEGYDPERTDWTIAKTPTTTVIHSDETGLFATDDMPSIFNANLNDERMQFRTRDGHTASELFYDFTTGGQASLKSSTKPPPISLENNAEHNSAAQAYRENVYDRRPQSLVGFCDSTREIQPPLDFEQYARLGDKNQ